MYCHEHKERAIKLPVLRIPSDKRDAVVAAHRLVAGTEQPLDLMLIRYSTQTTRETPQEKVGLCVNWTAPGNKRWLARLLGRLQDISVKYWCWSHGQPAAQDIPEAPLLPVRYSFAGETSFKTGEPSFFFQGLLTSLTLSPGDGSVSVVMHSREGQIEQYVDAVVLEASNDILSCVDIDGDCIYSGTSPLLVCIQVLPNIARLIA